MTAVAPDRAAGRDGRRVRGVMSRRRLLPLLDVLRGVALTLLALFAACAAVAQPAAGAWRWPVRGEVLTPFARGVDPYARGQHRGVDIAAPMGTVVRSACGGSVSFAGRVASAGRVVSVACGPWSVTYLHLGRLEARRGAHVAAGAALGTVGTSGADRSARAPHLHLGVRRRSDRLGYVDPLAFLGGHDARPGLPPLGAAPSRSRGPAGLPARLRPAPRPLARRPLPAVRRPLPAALRLLPAGRTLAPPRAGTAPASAARRAGLPLGGQWLPLGIGLAVAALAVPVLRRAATRHRRSGESAGWRRRAIRAGRPS